MSGLEPYMDKSLVDVMLLKCLQTSAKRKILVGGMDRLVNAFMPKLKGRIRFNSKVTGVSQDRNGVKVTYNCVGVVCGTKMDATVQAKYVIVTTTPKAMEKIRFVPSLGVEKEHSIRTFGSSSSTEAVLIFRKPFWPRDERTGTYLITDLRLKHVFYPPSSDKRQDVGYVIVSFGPSPIVSSDDELLDESLEGLAQIHNASVSTMRKHFVKGFVKRWDQDRWSLGAFAIKHPLQVFKTRKRRKKKRQKFLCLSLFQYSEGVVSRLGVPYGRVFFGGESTQVPHGWIDTAIKAGIKAAVQLHYENRRRARRV